MEPQQPNLCFASERLLWPGDYRTETTINERAVAAPAGESLESLQEARSSLPTGAHGSQEAEALDEAGARRG